MYFGSEGIGAVCLAIVKGNSHLERSSAVSGARLAIRYDPATTLAPVNGFKPACAADRPCLETTNYGNCKMWRTLPQGPRWMLVRYNSLVKYLNFVESRE